MVAVLVEYIRSLNQFETEVEVKAMIVILIILYFQLVQLECS